jgi:hypothetical protein
MGYVVRRLRQMGAAGASGRELMAYLAEKTGANTRLPFTYLNEAFLQFGNAFFFALFSPVVSAANEERVAELVQEHRAVWETQPFPELMRPRDYFSFAEFAQDTQLVVIVCGANPFAGRFVGRPGFGCYDGHLFVLSGESSPNEGLVAADPADPRLLAALGGYSPAKSYAEYVHLLNEQGYKVLGPDAGHVIEDAAGRRLYEGYRLHSVYDPKSEESAWKGSGAERLRGAINRRLGEELVRFGPHDDWEYRNQRNVAGPLWGPRSCLIEFRPDGDIWNHLRFEDLADRRSSDRQWSRLYPDVSLDPVVK